MTGNEIRKKFIDYFVRQNHTLVPSDSLVPKNDPTLMFTNAGMVQFKNTFLGDEKRPYTRAASAQKCVRAGGKHNDLEMVGRTARHHTFFEMLGNFSFGDYFKKDAIRFAWDFLTVDLRLPKEHLYVSVFQDDDDAFALWRDDIGLDAKRIYRLGEKDNFWAMGNTGPCGPCSEIYVDQGAGVGCGKPTCAVGCDCDRYLEIWNLVFMQYDRDDSGKLSPLPKPCIDTGMGLERLTAVAQGKHSNYDSDLLLGLIAEIARATGKTYGAKHADDVSIRVLADHARAAAFLIGDGVLPSNEGRGYVLRRILRRALRHGKLLGKTDPFFHAIAERVVDNYKDAYPELDTHRSFIKRVTLNEEENFGSTLNIGTQRLDDILASLKEKNAVTIPGEEIFKLYDTYGFPLDLVEETAKDKGFRLDINGFNKAMQDQKERALSSWKGSGEKEVAVFFNEFLQTNPGTVFTGYGQTRSQGRVLAILKNQKKIDSAGAGDEVEILLDRTPFYGESGGQAGDTGHAYNDHAQLEILAAAKPLPELIAHKARVTQGVLRAGDTLMLEVAEEQRRGAALHHTATHLLHAALKEVLGDHVKQAGSLVAPDRLRFDYTHFSPLTPRERLRIEELVNEKIWENIPVETREMKIDEALEQGATALFGEKYGGTVRVVNIPGFSKELCGGTHTTATGAIGVFKITGESSVASGVRRIEAATGPAAFARIRHEHETLTGLRALLKAQPGEETARLKKLADKNRQLEKEIEELKGKMVSGKGAGGGGLDADAVKIGDVTLLVKKLDGVDAKTMRTFIDNAKNQFPSAVIVVGSAGEGGKVLLAAGVAKELTERYHAGNILKEIAAIVGGSGGGRADMAQAGGDKPEMLDAALKKVFEIVKG